MRCSARHAALEGRREDAHHTLLQVQHERLVVDAELPRSGRLQCALPPQPTRLKHRGSSGHTSRGAGAAGYEDMDESKLAILEPPYARNQPDRFGEQTEDRFGRFLAKM